MEINFSKYSATGNDFIVIDDRGQNYSSLSTSNQNSPIWKNLCDRRQGIGADGVILLSDPTSAQADFKMTYLNADGGEVEMCGNGIRSITHFAHNSLKLKSESTYSIETMCGLYSCNVDGDYAEVVMTELEDIGAIDIADLCLSEKSLYLKVGVPHCLFEVSDISEIDLLFHGRKVRNDKRFEKGTNSNYFQRVDPSNILLRTYERGVEGETLACGTGAVAAGIAFHKLYHQDQVNFEVGVGMHGGRLDIKFSFVDNTYENIFLRGEVKKTFQGMICL